MKVEPGKVYAVITGDIVASSKHGPASRERLYRLMREEASVMRGWLGPVMPLDLDIYGGDAWQLLLADPSKALAAALYYRAFLIAGACDTRVAVAVGTVDFVPQERVSEGDGEAFRLSGRLASEAPEGRRMWFGLGDPSQSAPWDTVFDLIDSIITRHWTQKRALAVSGAVRSLKLGEIADLWSPEIADSTVHSHLQGACCPAISRAERQFSRSWGGMGSGTLALVG